MRKTHTTVIEDLSVKNMTASARGTCEAPGTRVKQKAGLNRAMLDVGFYEIRRQITYKSDWRGNEVIVAPRFYPSSQLCSTPGCDYRNTGLKLKMRHWTCPQCNTAHDRDDNAAANLERLASDSALREAFAKVTPVRHEPEPVRNSGQELTIREGLKEGAHLRTYG